MATIDAFWELAARESAPKSVLRMSLVRLGPAPTSQSDIPAARQRALIIVGIALAQLLFVFGLREAMRPLLAHRSAAAVPMQITIIERHPVPVVSPAIPVPERVLLDALSPPQIVPRREVPLRAAQPPRQTPSTDALRAIAVEPRPAPVASAPPTAVLFDKNGAVRVPAAPTLSHPRDLLAHRDVSFMLPGAPRSDSPDFHVRDDPSPQDIVNAVLPFVAQTLANGRRARPDEHGLVNVAADRGMRMSGWNSDPCEDIAQSLVDPDAKAREEATERYEQSCEGH